jgi:pimeloyl-ACP methyl ester carboxylesterase
MPTTATPPVDFRTVDGLRIRYADSVGPNGPTVLLTSPWPESVYAFAPMWNTLAEHARLFAIDLPGFGASERREDLLSPRAMGGFLAQVIAEAGLDRPHIVAPDVGTSAALFAAAAHPERIASVIVGTGGAAVPLQLGEPLRSRRSYRPVTVGPIPRGSIRVGSGIMPARYRAREPSRTPKDGLSEGGPTWSDA